MATAVKVGEETKQVLDRLQAKLTLELGRRPTLQELLGVLARRGWEQRGAIARDLEDGSKPLTGDELGFLRSSLRDWGPPQRRMSDEDIEIYEEDWKR